MSWIVSPQIHLLNSQFPVPQKVTVIGDKTFKEVIKENEILWVGL